MSKFAQFDVVELKAIRVPIPEARGSFNVRQPRIGDVATIVEVYREPPGYELECCDGNGTTENSADSDTDNCGMNFHLNHSEPMKNIQVIDGARNAVYDIFAATEEEFDLIFRQGTDIAFIDEVYSSGNAVQLNAAFEALWSRRVPKKEAMGVHGILFYDLEEKKVYYPTRRDEEAVNPNGSYLR